MDKKLKKEIFEIACSAKSVSRKLANISTRIKDESLKSMAAGLIKGKYSILRSNSKDLRSARAKGMPNSFIDRLELNEKRIKDMASALEDIVRLRDPVGEVIDAWRRPNGLWINKVRVPIGVVAIIYESRPNVTCDCAGLCLKSGNAAILRGGSEAINSNLAIFRILQENAFKAGIPKGAINFIPTTRREAVRALLKLEELIDLVIPRGGEGLIREVTRLSRIPVIKHYKGICHVYVDKFANLDMAQKIAFNAKVQRPGVCNAMETLLVHKDVVREFLPSMVERFKEAGVEIRGCLRTRKICPDVKPARRKDWGTEYLSLILSVKVVDSVEEAISHINTYGSQHSDSIVTDSFQNALRFLRDIDSACVYVNSSTRFTDGNQFGLGAEIGISTSKLHARGPMALEELTTYKYMVFGDGQVRE
jgi:glutamate-5-semialdehyde dehydrogenase